MIKAVRESKENYEREQEEARSRDQQLRLTRQTNRSDFNFLKMINSTPTKNSNTRADQPAVHFDTNTIHHIYQPTNLITNGNRYESPVNDSIIQGAGSAPGDQFMTNTISATGHNEPWRYNNGTNMATHMNPQACTTRPTSHNGFHNNSPNSSDNRNGPTCFKCGEQGHMTRNCKERVFCTLQDGKPQHKSMQEIPQQCSKPHKQPQPSRISPHSNTTTTNGSSNSHTTNTTNRCNQQRTIIPKSI